MIDTVADLIHEFVSAEKEILNEQNIKHPTTIGAMFEGLTAEVLNKSIFGALNLKVVTNSFIVGCKTEFDVMLVEGEGEAIPYTDRFKLRPEQVIVIIQVKKNLYSKDIEEGYDNLKFLYDYYEDKKSEKFALRMFRDSFKQICKKDLRTYNLDGASENEEGIYHALWADTILPIRIIWGYNGFSNEYNFRESFGNYLLDKRSTGPDNMIGGFGPQNFPNLIICGKYSMFKGNAMPFISPVQGDNWWPFYVSSSHKPAYFFLETIWSRLSYRFELSNDIFGEDLKMQPTNRFLDCRVQTLDELKGWEYNHIVISDKKLKANKESLDWQPAILDRTQHFVIMMLCKKGEINLETDKNLENFVVEGGYTSLVDFIEKLTATGLVYIENLQLKLLTDYCQCVILPDGRFVAGENKSGRLTTWVNKELVKYKEKNNIK
ncbi:DUF6602 domain-containing protein [Sphingobacterium spiritivorum]|uniref:DUF6602 domain-containing protein n=1 Tax=Sphingobacterium spiritivorum TaxID=258 RepID=UPI003DA4092D